VSESIRVLLVDDHALFQGGLDVTLEAEDDIEVVGRAVDGVAAVTLASETLPDVVLMDVSMPYEDGIRAVSAIKRAVFSAKILIFTKSNDEARLFYAIKAGAVGYLLKSGPVDEIIAAIRSVYKGMSFISPSMASHVISEFATMARGSDERVPAPRLTSRELEVLKLMVGEHTNREIARRLSISENTVKNHVRIILDKLQFYASI
jgi:DNA-binding NarL/FixJ family response regulator